MKQLFILFICILGVSTLAQAQGTRKVVADKIVGVVGDKIILNSDVFNEISDRQRRNEPVPPNAECYILEQILTIKALAVQAEKDSLEVSDAEVDALLDNRIRYFIQMYGTKEALEEISGRTVFQIKEDFRRSIKENKQAEVMRDKVVESIKITPQEVKAYYDKIPQDSLTFYEAQVEIGDIVVYPKAHRDLELMAMDELNEFKKDIESGKQRFETLARLYTDDPGSKDNGGMYHINRTEKVMDPAFISHAFRLREGQISPVFKSKFGYHIVQMVARAGDDATVRHILRIPRITDAEIREAEMKLDSIRSRLIAGTLTFGDAVQKYSDDEYGKFTGGMRMGGTGSTYLTYDMIDKQTIALMDKEKLAPGSFSSPMRFTDDRGKQGVKIVYLKSRSEPHLENLRDDYDKVATRALEEKKDDYLNRWFLSKIPTYYLMIDDQFRKCETLNVWMDYARSTQP